MRRILVDRARRRRALKHGVDLERVDLDAVDLPFAGSDGLVLQVHEALERLAAEDPERSGGETAVLCRAGECRSCHAFGRLGKDGPTPLGFRQGVVGASDAERGLACTRPFWRWDFAYQNIESLKSRTL